MTQTVMMTARSAAERSKPRIYVRAITRGGTVLGYGIYDSVGGMESEHGRWMTGENSADACLRKANELRDEMNSARGYRPLRA